MNGSCKYIILFMFFGKVFPRLDPCSGLCFFLSGFFRGTKNRHPKKKKKTMSNEKKAPGCFRIYTGDYTTQVHMRIISFTMTRIPKKTTSIMKCYNGFDHCSREESHFGKLTENPSGESIQVFIS